jgi:hypothetical protein
MNGDSELVALVDLIYEAVLDSGLWPSVLVKLAKLQSPELAAGTINRANASRTSGDEFL